MLLEKLNELKEALRQNAAPFDLKHVLTQVEKVQIDSLLIKDIIENIEQLEKLQHDHDSAIGLYAWIKIQRIYSMNSGRGNLMPAP